MNWGADICDPFPNAGPKLRSKRNTHHGRQRHRQNSLRRTKISKTGRLHFSYYPLTQGASTFI